MPPTYHSDPFGYVCWWIAIFGLSVFAVVLAVGIPWTVHRKRARVRRSEDDRGAELARLQQLIPVSLGVDPEATRGAQTLQQLIRLGFGVARGGIQPGQLQEHDLVGPGVEPEAGPGVEPEAGPGVEPRQLQEHDLVGPGVEPEAGPGVEPGQLQEHDLVGPGVCPEASQLNQLAASRECQAGDHGACEYPMYLGEMTCACPCHATALGQGCGGQE